MSRPTDEVKSHIVKCRIGNDLYEKIKGDNVSEVIRNALESFVTHKSDDSFVTQNLQKKIEEQEALIEFLKTDSVDPNLKDTLQMIRLSCASDEEADAFLKDFHDRLENGEYQIVNGKLKLGYHEVFEVLNKAETKKWLGDVWDACDIRGKTYQEGLRCVFKEGSIKAVEAIYADKQGGSG